MHQDPHSILKTYFGHSAFRPGQEALVDALLSGRDVLGVMPTGAGKSVCYQVPAMLLPGMTVVISPLISLMKDQVAALTAAGIPAACLNSSLTAEEYRDVLHRASIGAVKILYVAPERLSTAGFRELTARVEIPLVAVDEAHCVSQWGQDFRPSYLSIPEFLACLPRRPILGAFTATATETVRADIEKLLTLRDPLSLTTGFDRPNLHFAVEKPGRKDYWLWDFLRQHRKDSGIIYCATRKKVEAVCDTLREHHVLATRYHAGLTDEERRQNQEDFVYDRVQVMVATNAFGMGIDKSNVGFVIHYNMPQNIESYYQEAGRAGRDGQPAECVLLFSKGDVQTARYFIDHGTENERLSAEEQEFVRQQDLQRLDAMVAYCNTADCLRNYLLRYFGERPASACGNCGNCQGELVTQDITIEAQKILSGVVRVERKYRTGLGLTLIVRMLAGSREQRVMELGLDRIPTYGALHGESRTQIRAYIDQLITDGYLMLTTGEYPVLRVTNRARAVLFEGERVFYRTIRREGRRQPDTLPRRPKRNRREAEEIDPDPEDGLLAALRRLRMEIARELQVPAYVVFSNATLFDMAEKRPTTMEDFRMVSGVGEVKAARYGEKFIAEIEKWV
ncbi:MAG: DNA helicase RecQ [Ruminococcaceae bacterium]|nr:DNA helicase RecQ [Oscillospiraceae bacterium]